MNTAASTDHLTPAKVGKEAPWRWLAAGWDDLWRQPLISFGYGLVFVLIGLSISFGLWRVGLSSAIPVAAGAFALVGPLMAVGLYELSRRYQTGQSFALKDIIFVKTKSPIHIAYSGFVLLFGLMVWVRIAVLLYALFATSSYIPLSKFSEYVLSTPQGLAMLALGSVIGAFIGFAIFSFMALSVPMLMDRKMDILEATVRSIQAVINNPAAMLLWAWLIAVFIAVGLATAFMGLIVIFPLLGHATWHAYCEIYQCEKRPQ